MKHIKISLFLLFFLSSKLLFAQEDTENKGIFSGSFESNTQKYEEDTKIIVNLPQDKIASNNYLKLNYTFGKFSAGIQYEAYIPPLLGYSSNFEGSGIAYKFFSYRSDFIEITVGNFYEQFGNALIFRTYESRQLGLNNSLNGVNIRIKPTDYFALKAVYGKQRNYFEEGEGVIRGLDGDFDIKKFLKINKKFGLKIGGSFVSHYELYTGPDPLFPSTVNSYAGRFSFNNKKFSFSSEYVHKNSDPHDTNFFWFKTGNALLIDLAYTGKGIGMNLSLRRLENMDSRSERTAINNELLMNYLPANTKQHTYSLANIYPYSSQVMGEIGGQYNLFYKIKKGSKLGGKYGTKLSFNVSLYNSLDTVNLGGKEGFSSTFLAFGDDLYYQDYNLEINKKWSKKFKTIVGYINQRYNKGQVEGGNHPIVNTDIFFVNVLMKFKKKRVLRVELQHLSTKEDMKNWASVLLEGNLSHAWSFYLSDIYNYGNEKDKVHYYALGGSYVRNAHRIAVGYTRQRESLLCVGGVCRQVPAFKGFTLNITSTF